MALTKDGSALMDTLTNIGHEITDKTLAPLTLEEQTTLTALLKKIT